MQKRAREKSELVSQKVQMCVCVSASSLASRKVRVRSLLLPLLVSSPRADRLASSRRATAMAVVVAAAATPIIIIDLEMSSLALLASANES